MRSKIRDDSRQINFDQFNWTFVEYAFGSAKQVRLELGKMMDQCDSCNYRATQDDKRQSVCKACPFRIQMQVMGEPLWNSRVRVKRKADRGQKN